jgi:phenylalanyl-tRNA synthetase beta chain
MHISYRWLSRHVDLTGVEPKRVAELLTLHTAEVESLAPFAACLSDVVVGHVLSRDKHPDADKLGVCRVDVGAHAGGSEPLQIVCGAANVAAGQRVAVARIGTRLPGDFDIKKSKIRGVESHGMICSERELGLGDEHAGIWVLGTQAAPGTPVAQALGVSDHVIEIDNKSLTHRPDLWGHRGIARELAALLGKKLLPIDTALPAPRGARKIAVDVRTSGCSRYIALPIGGAHGGRSPDWLRLLLMAVGQRPIDLLVDVSNFVMLDLGQPNHLFDGRTFATRGVVVRDAKSGEKITTLDGTERTLEPTDLVIAAGDEPVALAGVMGGAGSKVEAGTSELVLEVATFDPARVRRTSARLALRTDSSARFEKSLDPLLPLEAAGHLVNTLRAIAPDVHLAGPVSEAGVWRDPAKTIALRPERVRLLLGTDVDDARIASIFEALEFTVDRSKTPWRVSVPARRSTKDLSIEEDLVEEVGRMIGYDSIASVAMLAPVSPSPREPRRALVRLVADRLAGANAFRECMTYSFVADAALAALGLADLPHSAVLNPVAEGETRLRRTVVPSVIGLVAKNLLHRSEVRLFEIGKGSRPTERDARGHPREVHRIALALARTARDTRFDGDALGELKGVIEDVLARLGAGAVSFGSHGDHPDRAWAHPSRRLAVYLSGTSVGFAAVLDPRAARALGIAADTAAAELDVDALLALPGGPLRYRPIPRFPSVKVDVALFAPLAATHHDVATLVEKSGKGLVSSVELFDVYRAAGEERKSLAYHVVLQAADRTLEEADQVKFLERLERAGREQGLELRRQ